MPFSLSTTDNALQELMTKIALDQGRKVKDHRPLANFVRRSWTELVAGGRKKYMKPQCVVRSNKRGLFTITTVLTVCGLASGVDIATLNKHCIP